MSESPDDRLRAALPQMLDTGNALVDAEEAFWHEEDGYEFECALLGIPETIEGVLRDMAYYTDKLRRLYVEKAIIELDYQEEHHAGSRRIG